MLSDNLLQNHWYLLRQVTISTQYKIYSPQNVKNAFSEKLSKLGFDMFSIFPVDLMHEVELGVWKALLIHLFRILEADNENHLHDVDKRLNLDFSHPYYNLI